MTDLMLASGSTAWTAGVRREVLSNGLTVLVQRDDSAPVVAVVTHVKAGFFDEPDRWVGISHVLEHMFFKGTARRGVGEIARATKAAGGYLNASTSYDHTTYFTVLPASGLETALAIQADALIHSVIDPGELVRELQVIIQEAKRKLDNPGALTHETLHEVMFDHHRIRRWRIGREVDLARFSRDDLWNYYRSRYVPARTIVALVGDLDEERALELARRAYGAWPAEPGANDPSPEEPPRSGVRSRTLRGDVSQGELVVGWRTVPPLHPDSTALDLGAAVLSAGRGSWLYQSLRETGRATWVSAGNYAPTELGVFSVSAEFDVPHQPTVLARVAEAVARLALLGPAEQELDRARALLLTRWARRMESMDGRAASLAAAEALEGVALLDREYGQLATLGPDAVRLAAARYLHPDDLSAVAYLPEHRGDDLTEARVQAAFAVTALARQGPTTAATAPAGPARRVPGSVRGGVRHTPLPGLDLLVRRKQGVPTVHLGMYVPRLRLDPPDKAGIGTLTVRSAIRGAGEFDATSLAFAFERLGGTLGSSTALDWLGFGTTLMADRLATAAGLFNLVFAQPSYRDADVEAERSLMAQEALQVADDMFRYPFQLAFRTAFGDAGYGLPSLGLPETIGTITPAEVRSWHASQLAGRRAVVVAVGDIEPERASEELAGVFRDYPACREEEETGTVSWAPGDTPREQVVPRQKTQSAVAMVFPGPSRRDPRRSAAEVWAAVASGLGGRLFEALRDRRSLAYTVMASAWQKGRAGALVTYIATSPERETEAREAMLEELRRFEREEIAEEERSRAVNYLAGQAEVNRQSGAAVASELVEAWLIGGGLDDVEDPAARFRAVTAAEVREVAEQGLFGTQRAEGVVRGTGGGR
ncbi:MAG: M16 family metallopeptidase [Gemmatimonadales bacterium]